MSTILDVTGAKKKLSTSESANAKPETRTKKEGTRVSTMVEVRGDGNKKTGASRPNRFRDGT